MWSKRSFKSDVSVSELLYLREKEGLSNEEIAKRCGVSNSTILQLIGPQREKKEVAKDEDSAV